MIQEEEEITGTAARFLQAVQGGNAHLDKGSARCMAKVICLGK